MCAPTKYLLKFCIIQSQVYEYHKVEGNFQKEKFSNIFCSVWSRPLSLLRIYFYEWYNILFQNLQLCSNIPFQSKVRNVNLVRQTRLTKEFG